MIVLDASAVVAALLNNREARRLLSTQLVHVPHLADAEVASALRRQVLAGQLTPESGWSALDRWRQLGISRHPVAGLLDRVWALRDAVSAYDACYVGLAEALSCPLVTADRRLAAAPGLGCPVTLVPE